MDRFLKEYKSGSLFKSIMILIIFIVVGILNILSCAPSKNYLEGTTTVTTSYYDIGLEEEISRVDCFPNFNCKKQERVHCINIIYQQVGEEMKAAVEEFKITKNKNRMRERFEFCLCGFLNIEALLGELKRIDHAKWKEFKKDGFIYHINSTIVKMRILITQTSELP